MKPLNEVLRNLYESNVIDEEALEKAAEYQEYLNSDGMSKEAASGEALVTSLSDKIAKGLLMGAVMTSAIKGTDAITGGISSLYNKATFKSDLSDVLKDSPDIARQHSRKDIESYYKTLRTFAPGISKDSNAARGFLMNALQYKDVGLPTSVVKELTEQQKGHGVNTTSDSMLSMGLNHAADL